MRMWTLPWSQQRGQFPYTATWGHLWDSYWWSQEWATAKCSAQCLQGHHLGTSVCYRQGGLCLELSKGDQDPESSGTTMDKDWRPFLRWLWPVWSLKAPTLSWGIILAISCPWLGGWVSELTLISYIQVFVQQLHTHFIHNEYKLSNARHKHHLPSIFILRTWENGLRISWQGRGGLVLAEVENCLERKQSWSFGAIVDPQGDDIPKPLSSGRMEMLKSPVLPLPSPRNSRQLQMVLAFPIAY
jgi:hypothetical protein